MPLDAVSAATTTRESLVEYLLAAYPINEPDLRRGFKELLLQPGTIAQDPYLEGNQPYEAGKSLKEFVEQGILDRRMLQLFEAERPLYVHQQSAVEAAVKERANIVVATGTGSGKTECFLIPMLQRLLEDPRPGMQALILYPMNALVNDQVKRLRKLLCKQGDTTNLIRFGFYTSRTEKTHSKAEEATMRELEGTDRNELLSMFDQSELNKVKGLPQADLASEATKKVMRVQAISREEIWKSTPQILITNYSMLEHMLMRPKERGEIFEKSEHLSMLVLDEAHTYTGSTGTEVAMLLRRFKLAIGIKQRGQIQAIATSASLGDPRQEGIKQKVCDFASQLFDEPFSDQHVIWGSRVSPEKRFGPPYSVDSVNEDELYESYGSLDVGSILTSVLAAQAELKDLVPAKRLEEAKIQSKGDIHVFLWHALAGHPHVRRLMHVLGHGPLPWTQVATHPELWPIPRSLDGEVDGQELPRALKALSNLVQIVTCARRSPEEQPLIPVRLHLLYRSMEGLFACINPRCPGAIPSPEASQNALGYGRLYLERRTRCESCTAPVLELSSCRKCGELFSIAVSKDSLLAEVPRSIEDIEQNQSIMHLTPVVRGILSSDEDSGEDEVSEEESSESGRASSLNGGYQLNPILVSPDGRNWRIHDVDANISEQSSLFDGDSYQLFRYIKPKAKVDVDPLQSTLICCPACGARRQRQGLMSRFTSFTDAPLSVVIDRLFELLSDFKNGQAKARHNGIDKIEKPDSKVLTFSDGRQDAAYFASDFQRSHTEILYRQSVWQAFLRAEAKNTATITEVEDELVELLRHASIPHPDRDPELHHKSYSSNELNQHLRLSRAARDLDKLATKRAREVLLCEFGLPSARRSSIEALGLLACHVDEIPERLIERTCMIFGWNEASKRERAQVFLYGLTDEIRLLGAVDIQDASNYFSETGGDDGGRPGILGNKGQPKKFLKKAKLDKERDVVSFKPRQNKDGQWSQVQNRLIRFVEKAKGGMPSWEMMSDLFDALAESGVLALYAGQGHQLAWRKSILLKTDTDWYECPRCKQIFHKPGLGLLDIGKVPSAFDCPAHKCQGVLNVRVLNSNRSQHYVSLIQRRPLSLTAEEHTAQLQPEELSERENRFRIGEINLLSSSTTLELGVDIGELQVVALRNFPPFVSNYQQRAGRAGRRADGLAVTVMYGQRRPHDRYFFEQPRHLISGSNKVPSLDISNFSIARRHAQAELIACFLISCHQLGTEDLTVGDFLGLPDLDSQDVVEVESKDITSYYGKLHLWLGGTQAKNYCKQILSLLTTKASEQHILKGLIEETERFAVDQVADWNSQVRNHAEVFAEWKDVRDRSDKESLARSERLNKARSAIIAELKKIRSRKLHDVLAQASILPIYGFPIDVVQLLTQRNDTRLWGSGGHRLQRDRRLALTEYAPGQEVVVDDRVHTSVAVVRPIDLETRFYWVCERCNAFVDRSSQADIKSHLENESGDLYCQVCGVDVKEGKAGVGRAYVIPRAFSTNWSETPKITPFRKPLRQPTSQVFLAKEQLDQDNDLPVTQINKFYQLVTSRSGVFFLSNQGPRGRAGSFASSGYKLCKFCGLDLSSQVMSKSGRNQRGNQASQPMEHTNPITGKACKGKSIQLHLAHQFRSDFLKLRFTEEANPPRLLGRIINLESGNTVESVSDGDDTHDGEERDSSCFWRSLTYALLAAASDVIDIDRSELDGLFRPIEKSLNAAELIIYDNVASGAGHSKKIAETFDDVLKRSLEVVSSCSCSASCYNCLRTYSNQSFHADLDRHLVRKFLEPIVGELNPDQYQKDFARHSTYYDIEKLPELLNQHIATARSGTGLALKDLNSHLTLSQLERVIDSHKTGEHMVHCLVGELPANDRSRINIVARRKLADWIESGYLELVQSREPFTEMFCFGKGTSTPMAGQILELPEQGETRCLISRSAQGVSDAYRKIQALVQSSSRVAAKDLETPGARVAFLKPSSYPYSVDELRELIGLTEILHGRSLVKADYSDRYFENQYNQRGQYARLFVELLDGPWISSDCMITIHTNQLKDEFENNHDLSRCDAIQRQFQGFPNFRLSWRNLNQPGPRLDHGRILKVTLDDQTSYLVIFDKGLDFVRRAGGSDDYVVIEKNYIVRTMEESAM
jgi:ATP-dependent helicase YprA (DUF1998 family)